MSRDQLCELIPHAGNMCLLDKVIDWDDQHIVCQTDSHRLIDNPLRCDTGLSAINGIEYGAQAMAIHAGLLAKQANDNIEKNGLLVSARNVQMTLEWLDTITESLIIKSYKIVSDKSHSIYEFTLTANDHMLVSGKTTVMTQEAG